MKIKDFFSPNFDKIKRLNKSIKILVIHYTGMQSERESLKRLCDFSSKVSCHYLINRDGKIFRLVPNEFSAWHAGKSCWLKYKNINKNSIGIELVNKGHRFGYTNFSKKQITQLINLCKVLIKKYKIVNRNIIGHSDIAPLRKKDPGEKFPWSTLYKKKIGIWHNLRERFLKKFRKKKTNKKEKIDFINHLKKIGYCIPKPSNQSNLKKIIKSFQSHYRKEIVNGVIDLECLIIAKNLAKKL